MTKPPPEVLVIARMWQDLFQTDAEFPQRLTRWQDHSDAIAYRNWRLSKAGKHFSRWTYTPAGEKWLRQGCQGRNGAGVEHIRELMALRSLSVRKLWR